MNTENPERLQNVYDLLKIHLLDGDISFEDVRKELMEMDQSTNMHDASEDNLVFLEDPDIVKYFSSQSEEVVSYYNSTLSFARFHVAQRRILIDDNAEEGLRLFKKSLENRTDNSFTAYIQGTVLYLEGKEIPEELILKAEIKDFKEGTPNTQRNMTILRNFNRGLKERGNISYKEDYSRLD